MNNIWKLTILQHNFLFLFIESKLTWSREWLHSLPNWLIFFFQLKLSVLGFWKYIVCKQENLSPLLSEQNTQRMNRVEYANFCPPHIYLLWAPGIVDVENTKVNNVMVT